MSVYLTGDTHFNHAGVIEYCERPYRGVREMNEAIIAEWNAVVTQRDEVWHLGDFGFSAGAGGDDLEGIFLRLHGRKHLVIGNHDQRNPKVLKLPWSSQTGVHWFKSENRRAMLCHYPMTTWRDAHRGSLMLHGHSHGTLQSHDPHRFDVGWDVWGKPVDFDNLWALAESQPFLPQDHHGDKERAKERAQERRRQLRRDRTLCPSCLVRPPVEGLRSCQPCRDKHTFWRQTAKYGLEAGRYDAMLLEQAGRCAVCRTPMSAPGVDHDHACCPGKRSCGKCVRGLLCERCNTLLGYADDRVETLEAAVGYLRAWKNEGGPRRRS